VKFFVGQKKSPQRSVKWGVKNRMEMSEYVRQLDYEARKHYMAKLDVTGERFPDPYNLRENQFVDDVLKWPNVAYGDLYNYLIKTPGPYTKESMDAYKSLEAYNFFYCGHVRTVFFYETSPTSSYAILLAKVNPSQKSASNFHEAWVLTKRNGTIQTAHCTCMAG